jgi:galactokinase
MLQAGDLEGFGASLYASHASSQNNFENSCAELDTLVEAARSIAGIYGARLSGGGFGGSVIVLVDAAAVEAASVELRAAYAREYGVECEVVTVTAAAGAALLTPEGQPRTINGEQQNEVT